MVRDDRVVDARERGRALLRPPMSDMAFRGTTLGSSLYTDEAEVTDFVFNDFTLLLDFERVRPPSDAVVTLLVDLDRVRFVPVTLLDRVSLMGESLRTVICACRTRPLRSGDDLGGNGGGRSSTGVARFGLGRDFGSAAGCAGVGLESG